MMAEVLTLFIICNDYGMSLMSRYIWQYSVFSVLAHSTAKGNSTAAITMSLDALGFIYRSKSPVLE